MEAPLHTMVLSFDGFHLILWKFRKVWKKNLDTLRADLNFAAIGNTFFLVFNVFYAPIIWLWKVKAFYLTGHNLEIGMSLSLENTQNK